MGYQVPGKCSICGHDITITSFYCPNCKTKTEGVFTLCKFCSLKREQLDFIEVFLKCRGNIKDVEKEMGISYPTIRNRLEEVLQALHLTDSEQAVEYRRENVELTEIFDALEKGKLTPQEALRKLRERR